MPEEISASLGSIGSSCINSPRTSTGSFRSELSSIFRKCRQPRHPGGAVGDDVMTPPLQFKVTHCPSVQQLSIRFSILSAAASPPTVPRSAGRKRLAGYARKMNGDIARRLFWQSDKPQRRDYAVATAGGPREAEHRGGRDSASRPIAGPHLQGGVRGRHRRRRDRTGAHPERARRTGAGGHGSANPLAVTGMPAAAYQPLRLAPSARQVC
jgi:hypothetical protein